MASTLTQLSATQLASQIRAGELSSTAVTQAFLERCEKFNPDLNAMLRFDGPAALEQAAAIDAKRKHGETLGLLAGVPVAVKDLVAMRGERLTCGSRMLENFVSPYDAGIVERLRAADAVFLGRTNMDEFAMGGTNENSAFGPVRNPWNTECTPGGSSGGAAAIVAADMVPLSIGSDTGGSIRQPAGCAGSPVSNQLMVALAGTGSSRSQAASINSDRWPAVPRTRRCCSKQSPATTRATAHRSTRRCHRTRRI